MSRYWPKRSELKDHFQPDTVFKDEFKYESDEKKYLETRDRILKKSKWKNIVVSYEK